MVSLPIYDVYAANRAVPKLISLGFSLGKKEEQNALPSLIFNDVHKHAGYIDVQSLDPELIRDVCTMTKLLVATRGSRFRLFLL